MQSPTARRRRTEFATFTRIGEGAWAVQCPKCHAKLGLTRTVNFALEVEPGFRTTLHGSPRIRVRYAEEGEIRCYGIRRGAFRHPHRSPVRGDLLTTRVRAIPFVGATPDERVIDYTNEILEPEFDTWCLGCGGRMRVDVAHRSE